MESRECSLTTEDSPNDTIKCKPEDVCLDVFPDRGNEEYRAHSLFMKVVTVAKNNCCFPIDDYDVDMESSEHILEYISLTPESIASIEHRKEDLVYEDNFNQSVMNMVGQGKYSYYILKKVCSKYENQKCLQEHIRVTDETWNHFQDRIIDKDSAQAAAFAIVFYTGSQSSGINRSASVIARKSNGEVFETIKKKDLEDASIILYYLVQGLAHIPYYWGTAARAIQLTEQELEQYTPGALITWLQFSSSTRGSKPVVYFADRNTHFIIYSLTGRSIKKFSTFPNEDEILFLPHSTFLVVKHFRVQNKHYIHMRQIELGFCHLSVLWVDDHIFDEKWENKEHMQRASTRSLNNNVHFIPKSTANDALSFLRSPFGQRLKNRSTFRIVTDMVRFNEEESQYAGANLLKSLRQLGFENQCLIYTIGEEKAVKKLNEKLTQDECENILITEESVKLHEFITFEI